ncbi:glycosyltransferase [Oscillochloris sp. ZM17-4]|uniref:glycosyltransferase n=1 Tax=Oscillochloris sp. ZM17-4 TaxID=2866714 RepID=UPI001C7311E2|nr:glycosyltransferase [Oscillochloris sp. ZM17-4]MBX0331144.1 glycosyltransferase [Oscillochloris sp. ZM17-4]
MILALLYMADRLLRLLALRDFFRRPPPPAPPEWPAATLIQPVTRGTHDLRRALASRAALAYPGPQQHLLVCDVGDRQSQQVVHELMVESPGWPAELILVAPDSGVIASKLEKIRAALPRAAGEVLIFVDDDVRLPPDALRTLLPHLWTPGAGASFGLARYEAWETPWSSLMSLFVNASALPSYVPLSYLAEPYTITGHCFALRRGVFDAAGGFAGMAARLDDDHELARRVRALGLRCVQTPLIYGVENRLATARAYRNQLRRWLTIPRLTMLPQLSPRERLVTLLASAGNLLPPMIALLAILRAVPQICFLLGLGGKAAQTQQKKSAGAAQPPPHPHRELILVVAIFLACYAIIDRAYLGGVTPARRWPLLLVTALLTPLHVLAVSLGGDEFEWRGQRIRLLLGGGFEVVGAQQARAGTRDDRG